MQISIYGVIFDDVYELTYNLLSCIGLEIKPDGSLYDSELNTVIHFNGKLLKANIYPDNLHYAGQGEVMFEPLSNIKQVTELLGYFIDKKQNIDKMEFMSYYTEEIEDPATEKKYTNLTIKYSSRKEDSTYYYHNPNIKFLDLMFTLGDVKVNLVNFDPIEVNTDKRKKQDTIIQTITRDRPMRPSPVVFK